MDYHSIPVYPGGHRDWLARRPSPGFDSFPTSSAYPTYPDRKISRAVIAESHPTVATVLEHLLKREGYSVELWVKNCALQAGPALLLASAEDRSGLYVFEVRDICRTLEELTINPGGLARSLSLAEGIHAFLPEPFGAADVLRVVRAVSGFDGSRERFLSPRDAADRDQKEDR